MSFSKLDNIVTSVAVIITILSFSPNQALANACGNIMYLLWGGTLVLKLLQHIEINNFAIWMFSVYVFWSICSKFFFSIGVYPSGGAGVVSYFIYCIAFYLVGFNSKLDDELVFKRLIIAFAIGQGILMLTQMATRSSVIIEDYFVKYKNQMGQMLGSGVVVALFILPRYAKNWIMKAFFAACGVSTFIVLLFLHSRTPVVAGAVVAIYMFILRKGKRSKDYWMAASAIGIIAFVIHSLGGMQYIKELFEENQYVGGSTLNKVTSGRIDIYEIAIENFKAHPLWGLGGFAYIDSFFFNTLRCGGLLLSALIFPLFYGKFFISFKLANKLQEVVKRIDYGMQQDNIEVFLMTVKAMILFYFVVSLTEGYPPFGPGASVFFLWILLGMLDKMKKELLLPNE